MDVKFLFVEMIELSLKIKTIMQADDRGITYGIQRKFIKL